MDPIHPIAPGPPAISRTERPPVQRVERVTRERDRPSEDQREREPDTPSRRRSRHDDDDDGEHRHIDVLV